MGKSGGQGERRSQVRNVLPLDRVPVIRQRTGGKGGRQRGSGKGGRGGKVGGMKALPKAENKKAAKSFWQKMKSRLFKFSTSSSPG